MLLTKSFVVVAELGPRILYSAQRVLIHKSLEKLCKACIYCNAALKLGSLTGDHLTYVFVDLASEIFTVAVINAVKNLFELVDSRPLCVVIAPKLLVICKAGSLIAAKILELCDNDLVGLVL